MFTTTIGLIGLASNRIQLDDIIVQIDHFYALLKIKLTKLLDSALFEVRSAAILRSVGSRSSTECKTVGCSCGSATQLYLLIGPCLIVSAKESENGSAKIKQKYCII